MAGSFGKAKKVIMMGFDGADPMVIKRMVSEGKLPNFKKVLDAGVTTEDAGMQGVLPTITPPNWATLATGAYPNTHGITCFWNHTQGGPLDILDYGWNSELCKAEFIWAAFERAGKKSILLNYPTSWPPTTKNSIYVDGTSMFTNLRGYIDYEKVYECKEGDFPIQEIPHSVDNSGTDCRVEGEVSTLKAEIKNFEGFGYSHPGIITEEGGSEEEADSAKCDKVITPIKPAQGWKNAPAGAKEVVLPVNSGQARRFGLITAGSGKDYGNVYILPNIAGFVGSDTVGVILSTGMHRQEGIRLAIDIGTNGEVALGSRDRMLVCSTAAGPAFEGARISHGMRAADGAIEGVKIAGGQVACKVIGDSYPILGICGSGLIQCAAEMLRSGIIDSTGRMLSPEKARAGSDPVMERIESREDQTAFLLVPEDSNTGQRAIYITQKDIRELQLAKGAIAAGIQILMKEMAITPGEIEEVFLAGAFGSYIDIACASLLGLLPPVPQDKIKSVGNAAGMGALQALLSLDAREEAQRIAAGAKNIELSGRADFQAAFVDALGF